MSKPTTQDGINFKMSGCTLRVLDLDDTIQKGDFIRPYHESPMMSQDGGWDTTYKNDKWAGPLWHRVEDDLSGWIGDTYRNYLKFRYDDGQEWEEEFEMFDEIVRVL